MAFGTKVVGGAEVGSRNRGTALVLHGNDNNSDIVSQDIVVAGLAEPQDHIGAQDLYHKWRSGQKTWHVCALIRPPYTYAQCNCKRYLWCTHIVGGALFV